MPTSDERETLHGMVWLKRARTIALLLSISMLLGLAVLTALQRRILFPHHLTHPAPGAGHGIAGLQRLWIKTDEGETEAWLLPGDGVSAARPGPAVVFAHGNAELIDDWPTALQPYQRHGFSVLLPEYRGYGRSTGSPSQVHITADLVRFYDLMAARPEIDSERILFHGRSLGGGALCALAAERRPAALILMSTFTSVRAMARELWLPGFLVADPFDNLSVIEHYSGPILLVHGTQDAVIPVSHAKQLHDVAQRSRLVLYPGADHNTCPPNWGTFWQTVWLFLRAERLIDVGVATE